MTDVEIAAAPPAVEDAAAPAEKPRKEFNHDEPLPAYDEALLERLRVKGKVRKPIRPDNTERDLQIEKLSAEVKKASDRIAEIKAILVARRTRTADPVAAEHQKKKAALVGEWQAVLRQKASIREEFQRANTEREVVKGELRECRGKIPRGQKLETLEADIQALEFKIAHDPQSIDEKKAQQQLAQMTAARPLARQLIALEEKLKAVEASRATNKQRLDQCDAVLSGIKEREQVETAALDALRAKREEGGADIPSLEVEKQECWEVIQALRNKMTEVREDYNKKWNEWSEVNKNYMIYMRHVKREEYLERQKNREARANEEDENFQAADKPTTAEPYESEIFTIDQLLSYLKPLTASKEVAAAAVEVKEVEVPQGLKAFKKKDEEDLSFFTSLQKTKGGKKGGKGGSASAPAPADGAKGKKINHSLEILKTFMQFNIEVPLTTDKLSETIAKAEAKKAEFLEKRKQAKEAPAKKESKVAEEEAPSSSSVATVAATGESSSSAAAEASSKAEVEVEKEVEEAAPAPAAAKEEEPAEEPEEAAAEEEEEEEAPPAPTAAEVEADALMAAVEADEKEEEEEKQEEEQEEAAPAPAAEVEAEEVAEAEDEAEEEVVEQEAVEEEAVEEVPAAAAAEEEAEEQEAAPAKPATKKAAAEEEDKEDEDEE